MAKSVNFPSLILATASLLSSAPTGAGPPTPLGKFSDLPNIDVTYYDVTGENVRAVHRSIEAKAPRDPATNKPTPATSDWSITAAVDTVTTGGQCQISGVKLSFGGRAKMPRLLQADDPAPISPELLATWQNYSAQVEARQVAQLRFPYDRLGQVEREIRAGSCGDWKAATSTAINRLKQEQAEARERDTTPTPKLEIPKNELQEEGVEVKHIPT